MLAGILLITLWLVGVATGGGLYDSMTWLTFSWFGLLVLAGSAWALWFHFLSGLRHFFYDARLGLEIEQARMSSWAIIIGSVVLTLISLLLYFI